MKYFFLLAILTILLLAACENKSGQNSQQQSTAVSQPDNELMQRAQRYFQPLPARAENAANNITDEKVKLGKLLFFDTRLSKNGNNSCNSCHNLATFGVDNHATSQGDAGKNGNRNSPSCINAALHFTQFWDGRAKDVEEQAGGPILNPGEMAIPSKEFLVKRLKNVKEYQPLFKAAFPGENDPVTYLNIQKSIAAFERTLLTPSPFDNYLKNNYTALNADEKAGLKTFIDVGCVNCHNGVVAGGSLFQKFGVFADYRTYTRSTIQDEGRINVTKQAGDKDYFKVASLRNVAKTYPYFHDGSVTSLGDAVKIMGKVQLNKDLTETHVNQIVTWLNSLTGSLPEDVKKPPVSLTM
jgi:cytochrome c peroxidase